MSSRTWTQRLGVRHVKLMIVNLCHIMFPWVQHTSKRCVDVYKIMLNNRWDRRLTFKMRFNPYVLNVFDWTWTWTTMFRWLFIWNDPAETDIHITKQTPAEPRYATKTVSKVLNGMGQVILWSASAVVVATPITCWPPRAKSMGVISNQTRCVL